MSEIAVAQGKQSLVLKVTGRNSGKAVLFMKLQDLYPECFFLIEDAVQVFPLRCLQDDGCPRNQNCMGTIARRVKYVFDTFEDAHVLLLYFTYPDRPGVHRAGVFSREMDEPRYISFNPYAWEKVKQIGQVYRWELPNELFLARS